MTQQPRTLLIDIETAPALAYIWDLRTRYVPLNQVAQDGHILCFAAGWLGEDELEFYSVWDDGEKALVKHAWKLLDEAEAVIHYNGNNFDIPRLNAEFLRYRLGPPSPSHQIDLYQTVKRQFRVISRSLRHMLDLLELDNKLQHKGMELWREVMDGVEESQRDMEAYNIQDLLVLEDLYNELLPWITNHPNVALWMDPSDDPKCPKCGSESLRFKGYKRTSVLSYKQFHCKSCGAWSRTRFAEERGENRRTDILRG